jgi:transcriptional regulator with XRE-family HTH domain
MKNTTDNLLVRNEAANEYLAPARKALEYPQKLLIGSTLIDVRIEKRLKQFELAKKVGVSASYLSSIERDKQVPDIDLLQRICMALDVPLYVFLFKAINEEKLDICHRLLIKEIKPTMEKITSSLYGDLNTSCLSVNLKKKHAL